MPDTNLPEDQYAWMRTVLLVTGCSFFAYLLLFRLPFTPIFSESDQLIFIHEGSRLLRGDVIYRDFFQFTFPGAPAYYHALLAVLGQAYLILPFTIIVLIALLSYLSFRISREVINGPLAYLPTLILVFFGTRYFGLDASHRLFSIVFALFSILMLIKQSSKVRIALAGLGCSLASFFTQQRGVVLVGSIVCFLIVERIATGGSWRVLLRNVAILVGSFSLGLSSLLSYFVVAAGIGEFFSATIEFPIYYYNAAPPNSAGVFAADLAKFAGMAVSLPGLVVFFCSVFYGIVLPIGVLAVAAAVGLRQRRLAWSELRSPALLAFVWTGLVAATTGHSPGRMFQIAIPALIFVCWYISRFSPVKWIVTAPSTAGAAGALVLLGLFQAIRMQTQWDYRIIDLPAGRIAFTSPEQARFYRFLSDATDPGDHVYEAAQPFVYFPLRLTNPTGMSQIWPFDYTRPEQVAAVIRDLNRARPKFIVWPTSYSGAPQRPEDHTRPLADFVDEHYTQTGVTSTTDGFTVEIMRNKDE